MTTTRYATPIQWPKDYRTPQQREADQDRLKALQSEMERKWLIGQCEALEGECILKAMLLVERIRAAAIRRNAATTDAPTTEEQPDGE